MICGWNCKENIWESNRRVLVTGNLLIPQQSFISSATLLTSGYLLFKNFSKIVKLYSTPLEHFPRYFLANVLQYQLFAGMCEAAVTANIGNPKFSMKLHSCDIYGSKNAGKRLRYKKLFKCTSNLFTKKKTKKKD